MKIHELWNELPECCQQCKNIKPGNINPDIFECSKNLILPTKKKDCRKQVKKREHIKERFKRFLVENCCFFEWYDNRKNENIRGRYKLCDPYLVLYQSFAWGLGKLPYEFWYELNKKWHEIIRTEYPEYIPK